MFFFGTCNAVAAREDRKRKYWPLGRRHLGLSLTLWRHNVKRDILNMTCNCSFPCSCVYWALVKARKIVWESHVIDSSSTTQCLQLQHCTYQRKTLFFALIKVSTFMCKREIVACSSPLMVLYLCITLSRGDDQQALTN